MKKYINIVLKIILSLILLMPILGLLGFLPEPTQDLYNTKQAFDFIMALNVASYIMYIMAFVHIVAIGALWTRREALAGLLILPIVVNILGFHAFLDGGLFTGGAVMANIMFFINMYLLWKNRGQYTTLLQKAN